MRERLSRQVWRDLDIPRDALVVFAGVSGSGKSSLAFGTLYAEAQRRYLESVSPYAWRLFPQMAVPDVDEIEGLPPAVALQQQRGTPSTRSSVGSVTTLSNLLRMLYSRAGDDPPSQALLVSLGYDVDRPWRDLPKKDRDWILFTDEQPVVPVYAGLEPDEVRRARKRKEEPSYQGTFTSARRHVLHTFAHTDSAMMKKRVARYMLGTECPVCGGKRLRLATQVRSNLFGVVYVLDEPSAGLHPVDTAALLTALAQGLAAPGGCDG